MQRNKKIKLKEFILEKSADLSESNFSENIYVFENNGWVINISFTSKTDKDSKDIISTISPQYFSKNDYKFVRKSLRKKAHKYGELELPYILAVCYYKGNIFLNEGDLLDALFGSRAYIPELKIIVRQKDGLWYSPKNYNNAKNTRLSGVLYFDSFDYNNDYYNISPKLFRNPWAKMPVSLGEIGIEDININIEYINY